MEKDVMDMKRFHETSRPRILIVEDDPDIRLSLLMLLEFQGYECNEAEHGQMALSLLETHEFDLIITDYHMPCMDGLSLIRFLTSGKCDEQMPILLFSCSLDESIARQAMEAGAYAVLPKPYDQKELLLVVNQALEANVCICS